MLYLVGQWVDNEPWGFQGIFSTKEKAIEACRSEEYFIYPVELDVNLPDENTLMLAEEGFEYPKA
jgi:hypothetical protein